MSESEGELKKRIRRWLDRTQDGCEQPHIEEDRSYIENKLSKFLEDARKAFPQIQKEHFPPQYPGEKDVYRDYVDKYEAAKWFRRYFGSTEVK